MLYVAGFRQLVFVLLLAAFLSGCATPMAVSLKEHQGFTLTRNPNKGYIFVYREPSTFGMVRGIYIKANGKRIGGLNNGTYFVHEADPGTVTIAAEDWMQGDHSRTIEVEAGKEYYIRGSLHFGIDAEPRIEIVHTPEGQQAIKGLKYSTLQ